MLSVTVICIGKLKEEFWRSASREYEKRLSRFCSLKIRELDEVRLSDCPSDAQIAISLKKEAEAILKEIPKDAFTVALCIEGKQISSEELSKKIEQAGEIGKGKVCFIIGSSFGLDDSVRAAANMKLSFSKMTFPHQLFRVLLLEQVYRAFSITNKMKYHK